MLTEAWIQINSPSGGSLALVLDASESAQQHAGEIVQIARDLSARLRGPSECSIYFLGDTQPHTIDDVESRHSRLFEKHRQRCSLLTPLLERLCEDTNTVCIVLCEGKIFDLEDWIGTAIADRLLLVNFGENTLSEGLIPECKPSVDQIVASRPLAGVLTKPSYLELSGKSVMPFFWDNSAYKWKESKLSAEGATSWEVQVGLLCQDITDVQVIIRTGSVSQLADYLRCTPQSWRPTWSTLSLQDSKIFQESIETRQYSCPLCNHRHQAEHLRCRRAPGNVLGRYVYSFLKPPIKGGFVLLKGAGENATYAHHPCEALRMDHNSVAINFDGKAHLYEFDPNSTHWVNTGRLEQYKEVWDRIYAIAI
jgi:hypothetical protein